MTDNVRFVDNIVTAFIFNTCRLRPQPSKNAVQAAMMTSLIASARPRDDENVKSIPLKQEV